MRRLMVVLVVAVSMMAWGDGAAALPIADAVNADREPYDQWIWGVNGVGWIYTPSISYDLAGVDTRFWRLQSRDLTVAIYDELPGDGGVILRSAVFTPSTDFAGGVFAPLELNAGEDYFVTFSDVDDFGVNVTAESGATVWDPVYYDFGGDGTYSGSEHGYYSGRPILRFMTVPEPAGLGVIGLALLAVRKKRS